MISVSISGVVSVWQCLQLQAFNSIFHTGALDPGGDLWWFCLAGFAAANAIPKLDSGNRASPSGYKESPSGGNDFDPNGANGASIDCLPPVGSVGVKQGKHC